MLEYIEIDDRVFRASPLENVFINFVSKDMRTDGGTTLAYNKLNPLMPRYVKKHEPKVGTALRYNSETRKMVVYNIVVSDTNYRDPLLFDIQEALRDARTLIRKYGDKNIVFSKSNPMIEDWDMVEPIIKKVFGNMDVKIKVYSRGWWMMDAWEYNRENVLLHRDFIEEDLVRLISDEEEREIGTIATFRYPIDSGSPMYRFLTTVPEATFQVLKSLPHYSGFVPKSAFFQISGSELEVKLEKRYESKERGTGYGN